LRHSVRANAWQGSINAVSREGAKIAKKEGTYLVLAAAGYHWQTRISQGLS
jgi:hypothetical protein